jgi:hypothetical protein
MKRTLSVAVLLALAVFLRPAPAADPPLGTVFEVSGKVIKVDDKTVSIQKRQPNGQFGEAVTFQITDTTRVTRLTLRTMKSPDPKMPDKLISVQNPATPKDIEKDQIISAIYTFNGQAGGKDVNTLLSAVIQPPRDKEK